MELEATHEGHLVHTATLNDKEMSKDLKDRQQRI